MLPKCLLLAIHIENKTTLWRVQPSIKALFKNVMLVEGMTHTVPLSPGRKICRLLLVLLALGVSPWKLTLNELYLVQSDSKIQQCGILAAWLYGLI